jgi:hypothetical protein
MFDIGFGEKMKKVFLGIYIFLAVYFLMAMPVHAYVDPSTTAILTQIIAGVFISLGVVFAVFRQKIVIFFKNIKVKIIKKRIEKANRKDEK